MGSLTLFMHVSFDGYAAGTNGEMDWIHVDDEIFEYGSKRIYATEVALYGRKTFQMMESYWPTAAEQTNASKHDLEHSQWYKDVKKVVLTKTMAEEKKNNVHFISTNIVDEIEGIKKSTSEEILVFGSPTTGHSLMACDLIDNYWLNINPLTIGKGIPVFNSSQVQKKFVLTDCKVFSSGVVSVYYTKVM
jgi:dihydrofolate reductase